jgi:radical SAM superfamily enzyme YgiQ (UPF0313 family)
MLDGKMKVTFLYPRIKYKYSNTPYPPLGIGYLSAMLKRNFGGNIDIDLIDGQILKFRDYKKKCTRISSDFLLISSTLMQLGEAKRITKIVKKNSPKTKVILGGPGPSGIISSGLTGRLLDDISFDKAIVGEGEKVIIDLIGGDIEGKIIRGKSIDINEIPMPDRNIFNMQSYLQKWKENVGVTSVHLLGSRGCPYQCSFCDKTVTGNTYRPRNIEEIVEEMEFLSKTYEPDDLYLSDDLFTISRRRVYEFCESIKNKKVSHWSVQGRVDNVDKDMLRHMKSAGCKEIYFGIESGSDKILNKLNKGFSVMDIINAFDAAHEVGILPGAYLLIGVPGETKKDMEQTIKLIERIKPSLLNISYLTPFPGTRIYEKIKHIISLWDFECWDDFSDSVYNPTIFEVSPKKVEEMIWNAYREMLEKEKINYIPYQYICQDS